MTDHFMTERLANVAIIPAAGVGARMQSDRAKQMLELGGVPLLVHTLRRFEECDAVDQIVLVLQPDLTAEVLGLVSRYGLKKIARVVAGGAQRQDSVYRGIQVLTGTQTGVVAIHDGVRPFITAAEINAVIERAKKTGAALMALPATDTIKQVKSGRVQRTLDRKLIYHAQTPQAFQFQILREAYEKAYADGFVATDDSQLVERLGRRVSIVEGSSLNIKITRPIDLSLAEIILSNYFNQPL
ncbi:MAG: 2-C-methyl-D-erythritol 4-phosphate cytidylyltransferase [Blastocatellia bacterium]